jgi:hypothetical protein
MTKLYQVDYDLRAPGRNYDSLINAIKALPWAHPLKSTWVVSTSMSASDLAAYLYQHMDRNDGLLVTRLQGEGAWYNLPNDVSEWLKNQLRLAA